MKILSVFFTLIISTFLISCENSYLMQKFRGKKEVAQAPAPQAPEKPAEVPDKAEPAPTKDVLKDFMDQAVKTPPKKSNPSENLQEPPLESTLPPAQSQESLREKIDGYINCLNRTEGRTRQSYERYISWVDEKAGPNCKERYITYGLYNLYADGIQKCRTAVEKGKTLNPALPKLDQSMKNLTEIFAQLIPLTEEAVTYYQQKDYLDDNCVKAKELHPKLIGTFTQFLTLAEESHREIKPKKKELDEEELSRFEKEGKKLQGLSKKYLMSAEALVDDLTKDRKVDSARYLQDFAKLEVNYQNLKGYVSAHPEEVKSAFMFSSYMSATNTFFAQAKDLKRSLSSGAQAKPRDLNKLIRDYNSLASRGNSLRF